MKSLQPHPKHVVSCCRFRFFQRWLFSSESTKQIKESFTNSNRQNYFLAQIDKRRNRRENLHHNGPNNINGNKWIIKRARNIVKSNDLSQECSDIMRANDSCQVMDILKTHLTTGMKIDIMLFTAAIKKCDEFGDWRQCLNIANMGFDDNLHIILNSNSDNSSNNNINNNGEINRIIKRDIVFYACIFDALANGESLDRNFNKFYSKMINIDKIEPDIVIANTLLKGCKKERNIKLCEKVLSNVIEKYNLQLDEISYNLLIGIYGHCNDSNKAKEWFDKLLVESKKKNSRSNLNVNIAHFGAIIHAFSLTGNINEILKYKQLAENEYNIKLSNIAFMSIIHGFIIACDGKGALKMFKNMIKQNGTRQLNSAIFGALQVIYLMLLYQTKHNINTTTTTDTALALAKKKKYFKYATKYIPNEMEKEYNLRLTHSNVDVMFQALLMYYNISQWDKAVPIAQKWIEKYKFGHWAKTTNKDTQFGIDLHGMSHDHATFRLRYVFKYESDRVIDLAKQYGHIYIITGAPRVKPRIRQTKTGKFTDKKNIDTNQRSLKQIVIDELKEWDENLIAKPHQENEGVLILKRKLVETFCHSQRFKDPHFVCIKTNSAAQTLHKRFNDNIGSKDS